MADPIRTGPGFAPFGQKRSAQIRTYFESLLKGPLFAGSPRRGMVLRYLVERTLAGEGDHVNEYSLALDVFHKPTEFDPRFDSLVRTDVTRLRQRLRSYYAAEGRQDPVHFDIPARSYRVVVTFHDAVEVLPAPAQPPKRLPIAAIAGASILLVAVGAGALHFALSRRTPAIESLVVLPFQDLSPNHDSSYLADGLTDELTNDLANTNGLRVIARTSAFQFKDKRVDVRTVGNQLRVEAVLAGSLERDASGHVRIHAQLSRTADGYSLWSHSYDLESRDLLSVQQQIARSIADDLQLSRTPAVTNRNVPTNQEAHDLYLRGRAAWNTGTLASFQQAVGLFAAATQKDPHFARAWLDMAKAHWNIALWTGFTADAVAQLRAETQEALDLAPDLIEAHAILGHVAWNYDYDWPRAETEFRLALTGAAQANSHSLYGLCLAQRGRFTEAHQQFRLAEELSPLEFPAFFNEAQVYEWERRPADAERMYRQLLQAHPELTPPLARLAYLNALNKNCTAAASYAAQLARISPNAFRTKSVLWSVDVCQGRLDRAREVLNRDLAAAPPFELAAGFAELGDADRAIQYLQAALDQHAIGITSLKVEPTLAPLHSDARFQVLERKLGLDP